MSILDRPALEQSPLADLHAIASELSLDGYRRLRKPELIDAIIERQGGAPGEDGAAAVTAGDDIAGEESMPEDATTSDPTTDDAGGQETAETPPPAPKRRRGRAAKPAEETGGEEKPPPARRRRRKAEDAETPAAQPAAAEPPAPEASAEAEPATEAAESEEPGEPVAEGVVEVLSNGSGFLRVNPPEPSDADVYISAAQVKRCELVSGDRIAGPRRAPRRSERFASLVRVDTINGRPANEVADSARFDELPAGFPVERLRVDAAEPPLEAIESLTPIGRGSRVTICGPAQAGKTRTLYFLARALRDSPDVQLLLVLAGARPEEVADWAPTGVEPTVTATLAGSADAQVQAVERGLDQGRRLAARGNHVVVLIDTVGVLPASAARRALASARRIVDGGSLTVIATSPEPLGGETTVIALDAELTAVQQRPVLDAAASWTMRPDLLIGDDGAQRIAHARAEALGLAS